MAGGPLPVFGLAAESGCLAVAQFGYVVLALVVAVVSVQVTLGVFSLAGHYHFNFRGKQVPQSIGFALVPVLAVAALYAGLTGLLPADVVRRVLLIAIGFGLLGLLDDVFGNARGRGLAGHLRRLVVHGEVTTGLVKAAGGLVLSGLAVLGLPGGVLAFLLRLLVVALSANMVNLLDLRPGRALKAFVLLAFGYALYAPSQVTLCLLYPALATVLVYLPLDLSGQAMLGDAGANAFGALLGLVAALTASTRFLAVYLLFLLALHAMAERVSLSELIEKSPFFNFLDSLGQRGWR